MKLSQATTIALDRLRAKGPGRDWRNPRARAHRVAPARAYRTVTGKWEAPAGSPRSGSA